MASVPLVTGDGECSPCGLVLGAHRSLCGGVPQVTALRGFLTGDEFLEALPKTKHVDKLLHLLALKRSAWEIHIAGQELQTAHKTKPLFPLPGPLTVSRTESSDSPFFR